MSMRGTKALREDQWRCGQRVDGYAAGLTDQPAIYADQHYQRGYRLGQAMRKRIETEPTCVWHAHHSRRPWADGPCGRLAPRYEARDYETGDGSSWVPVCGVHRLVVLRRSPFDVRLQSKRSAL